MQTSRNGCHLYRPRGKIIYTIKAINVSITVCKEMHVAPSIKMVCNGCKTNYLEMVSNGS